MLQLQAPPVPLYSLIFWLAAIVLATVEGYVLYSNARYKGHSWPELLWPAVPALVLALLLVLSYRMLPASSGLASSLHHEKQLLVHDLVAYLGRLR